VIFGLACDLIQSKCRALAIPALAVLGSCWLPEQAHEASDAAILREERAP
jgi:hypothetical protein